MLWGWVFIVSEVPLYCVSRLFMGSKSFLASPEVETILQCNTLHFTIWLVSNKLHSRWERGQRGGMRGARGW